MKGKLAEFEKNGLSISFNLQNWRTMICFNVSEVQSFVFSDMCGDIVSINWSATFVWLHHIMLSVTSNCPCKITYMINHHRCQHQRTKKRDRVAEKQVLVVFFTTRGGGDWYCSTSFRSYTDFARATITGGIFVLGLMRPELSRSLTNMQNTHHFANRYMARSNGDLLLRNRQNFSESLMSLVVTICCRLRRANLLCRALEAGCGVVWVPPTQNLHTKKATF